ncbi:unnamed protein product [Cylindrotheca closterium]|uniref:Helicase-associated domain-containing protein n=1 Tax=Cylindrotheca closterium TaxID=2856 RepID=A0AAD2CV60_9STRA|nr:unnamed protein product [Cylindrotheca closterium]
MSIMFSTSPDNDKLQEDSYSFPNIADDSLLSLMRCPLPLCLDHARPVPVPSSSSPSSSFLPLASSFEDPFNDPGMEPLPLRSQGPVNHHAPLTQSMRDDYLASSFMELLNKPNDTKLRQEDLVSIANSKRSSEAFFPNQNQGSCKRQRTSHMEAAYGEESMPRFRPYQDKQWRAQFAKLVQYKLLNGHCCVPHSYSGDPTLARWVKRQRYQYKKFRDCDATSTITAARIQELESIGFVWHSHASAWLEKVNELKVFMQRTGHCNVPSHYPENTALSTWVKCQRRQYKVKISGSSSSTMTMERFQMLQSLGFVFEPQLSRRTELNMMQ